MNDFNKRLNEIYPPSVFNLILITILCGVALIFTFDMDNIFNVLTILVLLVWFNVLLTSIDSYVIRRKILSLTEVSKKELVQYLNYRITREKRKIRIFRGKGEIPIVRNLKSFILDIEKDIIKIW